MDSNKATQFAKACIKKITGFFRYHYYDRLMRKGKELHNSTLYVPMHRDLAKYDMTFDLRSIFKRSPESCEEPEEDVEILEPETETEPGLLRELTFVSLITRSVHMNEITYLIECVKDYEDRVCIWINRVNDGEILDQKELILPRQKDDLMLFFEMDGLRWSWEIESAVLRIVQEDAQ